jgi:hypothetical protein
MSRVSLKLLVTVAPAAAWLAGCSSTSFEEAERPKWRQQAEAQCMARKDYARFMAPVRDYGGTMIAAAPPFMTPRADDGAPPLAPSRPSLAAPAAPMPPGTVASAGVAATPPPFKPGLLPPLDESEIEPDLPPIAGSEPMVVPFPADGDVILDGGGTPIKLGPAGPLSYATVDAPALAGDRQRVAIMPIPEIKGRSICGADQPLSVSAIPVAGIDLTPSVKMNCPTTVAFGRWVDEVMQPAAVRHFGQPVRKVLNSGSYQCRSVGFRRDSGWSEHAFANAIDVTGFELADGTRFKLLESWPAGDQRSAFLREVQEGACGIFTTVLGPEFDAQHANHFHFDMRQRRKPYCR